MHQTDTYVRGPASTGVSAAVSPPPPPVNTDLDRSDLLGRPCNPYVPSRRTSPPPAAAKDRRALPTPVENDDKRNILATLAFASLHSNIVYARLVDSPEAYKSEKVNSKCISSSCGTYFTKK
ncbi:hypothetical protein Trydic_g4999 [Trypoxylus dichotomus]